MAVLSWSAVVATVAVYIASLAVYRFLLHPLARFPGPKLAAITRWYEGYYDVIQYGQYTFKIAELHKKYGPIIRISPNELHINDHAFFDTLYRQEGRWDKYAWAWDAWGAPDAMLHTVDHDQHKARRQPLGPFFSKAKVHSRQDMICHNLNKLCDRLTKFAENRKTVDLGVATTALARDIAFEFILAKSYNSLDREDFDIAVIQPAQAVGSLWRLTKHVGYVLPMLNKIPVEWAMKISDDQSKIFFRFLKNVMQDTQSLITSTLSPTQEYQTQRTIVHEILDSRLPASDKTFDRIFWDVTSISGAGFTTGSTLHLILFHVFSDRKILQQLRAELDTVKTKDGHLPELKVLEQLPYLTATLKEGLRLSPGIATRMARIAPDRDLFYEEWCIPAGTPVGMSPVILHTGARLYPDPYIFDPERWINRNGHKNIENGWAPFSRGTRICLGMHLAWAEMYLALAALVPRFNFDFVSAKAGDFKPDSDQFVIGTKSKGHLEAYVSVN